MHRPLPRMSMPAMLLAVLTCGCGQRSENHVEVVPIRGKITYQGNPVTTGTISFISAEGQPAQGTIQPDGTYQLSTYGEGDGASLGRHMVGIIANEGNPKLMSSSPGYVPPKELIPKKFNDPKTSDLTATVTKDNPVIDFNLK